MLGQCWTKSGDVSPSRFVVFDLGGRFRGGVLDIWLYGDLVVVRVVID